MNQTFVRAYFPNEIPIGQTLKVGKNEWQIIGVCRDGKYTDIRIEVPPTVYFSYRQTGAGSAYMALRTMLPPLAVVAAARKAVAAVDANVPLADITTQEAVRDHRIAQEIMFATLVSALAGLAVLLACLGLYGLMAYNVTRRTSEFGVRIALGAQRGHIVLPIVREALRMVLAGTAVGVPTAIGLAQLIKSQLYGVKPVDPSTLALGGALLVVTAIAAAWLPARRASRVDPIEALRAE